MVDNSFGSNPKRSNLQYLIIKPQLNVNLPREWFVNSTPEIRADYKTGKWFVPLDVMLGKKLGSHWVTSIEYRYGVVRGVDSYKSWIEARIGYFFKVARRRGPGGDPLNPTKNDLFISRTAAPELNANGFQQHCADKWLLQASSVRNSMRPVANAFPVLRGDEDHWQLRVTGRETVKQFKTRYPGQMNIKDEAGMQFRCIARQKLFGRPKSVRLEPGRPQQSLQGTIEAHVVVDNCNGLLGNRHFRVETPLNNRRTLACRFHLVTSYIFTNPTLPLN